MIYNFGDSVTCQPNGYYGISTDTFNIIITRYDVDDNVLETQSFRKGHFTIHENPREGIITIIPDPVATANGITAYGKKYSMDFGPDTDAGSFPEVGFNMPLGCTAPVFEGSTDYTEFLEALNSAVTESLIARISGYNEELNELYTVGTRGNYVEYEAITEGPVSSGFLLNVPPLPPIFEVENLTLGNGMPVKVKVRPRANNEFEVVDTWVIPNTSISIVSGTNPAAVVVNVAFTAHDNLPESPTYRRRFNVTVKDVNNQFLGSFQIPNPSNANSLTNVSLNLADLVGLEDAKSFSLELQGSDEIGWQTTPTIAVYEEEVHALIGSYSSNVVGAIGSFGAFVRFGRDAAADGTLETLQSTVAYTGSEVSSAFSGPAIANGQVVAVQMMSALSGGSILSEDRRRFPTPAVSATEVATTPFPIAEIVSSNTTEDNIANTYQSGIYDSSNDIYELDLVFASIIVNNTLYEEPTITIQGTPNTAITPEFLLEQFLENGAFGGNDVASELFANSGLLTGTISELRVAFTGALAVPDPLATTLLDITLTITHTYSIGAELQSITPAGVGFDLA